MSVQAISWVIEESQHKGSAFVVLLMIANHAHADGSGAFPNLETLARESRITTRQVSTILGLLERSRELVVERGKGPRGSNLYSLPMQQHPLPLEKISSGRVPQFSSRKRPRETSTEPSLTVLEENRQAAPVRPSQDTRTATVHPVENGERQFADQVKNLAREKSLPRNGRPTEPLRAELYDGIYRKKVENVFLDLCHQSFNDKLRGCVSEAVTYLMLNRIGKMMELRAEDVEKRAIEKLEAAAQGLAAMAAMQNDASRAVLVSRLVARVVSDAAAELIEARRRPPETSTEGPLQVAV